MTMEEREKEWKDQADTIVEAYEIQQIELNHWECEFVNSILFQLGDGKQLSFKQSKILRQIYNKIG